MNSDDEYKFNPERKYQGLALVVVNFTSGPDKRIGSENDVKYLKKTFKRLGFKVVLKKDVSRRKFTDILYKCKYIKHVICKLQKRLCDVFKNQPV